MADEPQSSAPLVQRGLWDSITSAGRRAIQWAERAILAPLRHLAASAAKAVGSFGALVKRAWDRTHLSWGDLVLGQYSVALKLAVQMRRDLAGSAVRQERDARRRAAEARGDPNSGHVPPGPIERLDDAIGAVEDLGGGAMGVADEIVEGAVLGDFKKNPSIWNTIGQVAIGFVPYAGQVADVRDTIAAIKTLHEGGWKDPWAWVNLVLTGIGWIPGVGDAVKGIGKPLLRRAGKYLGPLVKGAKRLWRGGARRASQAVDVARRFGRRLSGGIKTGIRWARGRVTALGSRLRSAGAQALRKGRAAVSRALSGVRSLASRAASAARGVLSRGAGLLGRAVSALRRVASNVAGRVRSAVDGGRSAVTRAIERGRSLVGGLKRRLGETVRRGADLARRTAVEAVRRARAMAHRAASAIGQRLTAAWRRGRALVTDLATKAKSLVARGVTATRTFIRKQILDRLGRVRDRVLNTLKRKWEDLKRRFKPRTPAASLPTDPNKMHHIFGQTKHNWSLTGLDQAGNERLLVATASNDANLIRSFPARGKGTVLIFEQPFNGHTVEARVFEGLDGTREIADGWVK